MGSESDDFNPREGDFGRVHRVAPGVYTLPTRFDFMGVHPINNRSVIVHVPGPQGGALAIINPAELLPAAERDLRAVEDATGAHIKYLISPGDWHHLFIGDYLRAFPEARAYVPPGRIPSKAPSYEFSLLDVEADNPLPELAPALVAHSFKGLADFTDPAGKLPRFELVFYLPSIRALTSGDVLAYSAPGSLTPALASMGRVEGRVQFHFFNERMVRDARAVERSRARVRAWDFDRYISIHGPLGNMLERGRTSRWRTSARGPGASITIAPDRLAQGPRAPGSRAQTSLRSGPARRSLGREGGEPVLAERDPLVAFDETPVSVARRACV